MVYTIDIYFGIDKNRQPAIPTLLNVEQIDD